MERLECMYGNRYWWDKCRGGMQEKEINEREGKMAGSSLVGHRERSVVGGKRQSGSPVISNKVYSS